MRPRKTPSSNYVYRLAGGTEDNDLHVLKTDTAIVSVWEPTPEERAAIACGDNVELTVVGQGTPPIAMATTREQPTSLPQRAVDEDGGGTDGIWLQLSHQGAEAILVAGDLASGRIDRVTDEQRLDLNDLATTIAPLVAASRERRGL